MSEAAAALPHETSDRPRWALPLVLFGAAALVLLAGWMRGGRSGMASWSPPRDEFDETVFILVSDLIGVARQGAKALRQAGVAIDEERLRLMLRDMAMERGHTAALLQQALLERGMPAVHGHEPTGDVVPEWRRVERFLRAGDTDALLAALAAAERVTLDRFRQALRCPLPDDIRLILGERLFAELEPSRNRLSALGGTGATSRIEEKHG